MNVKVTIELIVKKRNSLFQKYLHMKKLLYFLLATIISYTATGQKFAVIKGSIITDDTIKIQVYKPVNGFFNSMQYPSEIGPTISKSINNNLVFNDSVQVNTFCFIRVQFSTVSGDFITKSDILVFPGDSVEFCYTTKDSTIKFKGNNAKGHELLYSTTDIPARISLPADDIINAFPNNRNTFVNELVNYGNTLSNPFKELLDQGFVTPQYYQTVNEYLHMWPIQMAATTLLYSLKRGTIIPQQTRDSCIEEIYIVFPPTSKFNAFFIANSYFNDFLVFQAYKTHHFVSPKDFYAYDTVVISQNGKQISLNKEFVRFLYIEDLITRQAEWGQMLTAAIRYAPGFIEMSTIEGYEALNPTNNWSKIIRRQFDLTEPDKPVEYKLTSPVKEITDSIQVNTFNAIIKQLPKSGFYFVDIWSSWCAPCVRAFRENDYIDSVLQVNHISKLYVSIDKNKEAWLKAVNKYALGGYQIMANESLIIDMKEMLGININSNFTIPKYLLLNAKGEFVKELYSPITRSKLAEQIKELMEKTN